MKKSPLTNFFFELGMLKKIEHCGTKFAGVKYPDTLGEHTCRAAQIGFALALAEKGNPERVALMCLFHDMGEIRIGDAHRIAQRYLKTLPAEEKAVREQTEPLPSNLKNSIRNFWKEFHEQKTRDSKIARDADLLETMLQAKEYLDIGYSAAARWLENGRKYLKTKTAKKLFRSMQKVKFTDWWDHLNRV
jgi:putative hydrolase of HD superfamily